MNNQSSTRPTLVVFQGQPCSNCKEMASSVHRPFQVLWRHLKRKLKTFYDKTKHTAKRHISRQLQRHDSPLGWKTVAKLGWCGRLVSQGDGTPVQPVLGRKVQMRYVISLALLLSILPYNHNTNWIKKIKTLLPLFTVLIIWYSATHFVS